MTSNGRLSRGEFHLVEVLSLEISPYCFECIWRIARQLFQMCFADVTTQLRQCIFDDLEVLVLVMELSLPVKTQVGRPHITSHLRNVKFLWLWKCTAGGSECEILVELAIPTMFSFLVRWMECGVCRKCSFRTSVALLWSRGCAWCSSPCSVAEAVQASLHHGCP